MGATRRALRSRRFSGMSRPVSYPYLITGSSPAFVATSFVDVNVSLVTVGAPPDVVVQMNGVDYPARTNRVSATQVDISVPAALLAEPGAISVRLTAGSGNSNSVALQVQSVIPTISSVSPTRYDLAYPAGNSTFTLNGTGYYSTTAYTRVLVDSVDSPYMYVSATQLQVSVPNGTAKVYAFQVQNLPPGGGTSAASNGSINYPAPATPTISPTTATISSGDLPLTVTGGANTWRPGSVVTCDGVDIATTYVSNSALSAVVPGSVIATGGTKVIRVRNPTTAGGGGTSGGANLVVSVPTTSSLSSASRVQFFDGLTLTVTGTNFTSTDTVRWDGTTNLTTTFVNSTTLQAVVTTALLATSGAHTVGVRTAGGYDTNTQAYNVIAWAPTDIGSSLRLWLHGSSLVDDGSGKASQWSDLSGGARHFTQATSANRPTIVGASTMMNNQPVAYFDGNGPNFMDGQSWVESGATGYITKPAYTVWACFSAVAAAQVNANPTILGDAAPALDIGRLQSSTIETQDDTGTVSASATWSSGQPTVIQSRKAGGSILLRVNRGAESSASAGTAYSPATALLGRGRSSTWYYTGQIGEVLITDNNANRTHRVQVMNRLGVLYGASMTAPGTLAAVSSCSPSSATQFDLPFTLTVTGSGFVSGDVVNVDAEPLATTFFNSTTLYAATTSTTLATSGVKMVTVTNAEGISAPTALTIAAFVPGSGPNLTSVSPNTATQYDDGFPITCTGTNFASGAVVKIDGVAMTTYFDSSTQVRADVTNAVLYTPGTKAVTVTVGASTSGPQNITVSSWGILNLTGLTMWLRADDVVTSGSAVTQMNDKSGNGRHVAQASGTKQPLLISSDPNFNNKPSVDFDGTNDQLDGSVGVNTNIFTVSTFTCAAVYRADAITGTSGTTTPYANNNIVGLTTTGFFGVSCRNTPVLYAYINDGTYKVAQNTALAATTTQQFVYRKTGGNHYLSINNNTEGSVASGNAGFSSQLFSVASSTGGNYFNGQVAEVVTCTSAWTATEKTRWKNYCADRYGI